MAKKEKNIIEKKWVIVKAKSKEPNYNLQELDYLTSDLIAHLAQLTDKGIMEIDGISIDMYKDRVWWVIEKIGLLPEYRDEDEDDVGDDNDAGLSTAPRAWRFPLPCPLGWTPARYSNYLFCLGRSI